MVLASAAVTIKCFFSGNNRCTNLTSTLLFCQQEGKGNLYQVYQAGDMATLFPTIAAISKLKGII